ncbi:MAG: hypothetical protein WBK51_00325 [Polaromonas sp.]
MTKLQLLLPPDPTPSQDTIVICRMLALMLAGFALQPAWAEHDAGTTVYSSPAGHGRIDQEKITSEASKVVDWVVDSADNAGMPFMIIDKTNARVMMFDATGRLQGSTPALLGLAKGDDSTPGIGQRRLSTIRPEERTTPAGRFVASLAKDIHDQEILWVDYDTALSLHRVAKGTVAEKRSQRLDSATPDDNRISYGCINVPVKFYEMLVSPAFSHTNGIVYILPETRTAKEVFGSYEVGEPVNVAKTPDNRSSGLTDPQDK